jgi:hypothetical protein
MAWFKGFYSKIWRFVCLVAVVGSGIIVVVVLMISTANAVTITGLEPDPLYLLPSDSDELILTISEPAETSGQSVGVLTDGDITAPANVIVLPGETMAPILVTSSGVLGEALVTAFIGPSTASAQIIITEDIPPVPIPGAVWLLGSGLLGLGLLGWRRKQG